MNDSKTKRNILVASIAVVILIIGIIGLTIAYFAAQAESEDITVTSKSLTLKYGPDPDSEIIATDIGPITEEEITTEAVTKTFSIAKENDTDKDVYARIDIADIEISDNFKDYDLKWALYQGEEKVTTGSFVQTLDGNDTINMANNVLISSTTPIEYTLYIWIQETDINQSELMAGSLTAKVRITGESEEQNTLVSNILGDNNSKVTTSSPTFDSASTDNGLFVQTEDSTKSNYGVATYYYRGDVMDNFVQFGTYKSTVTYEVYYMPDADPNAEDSKYTTVTRNAGDAILWRIVRINEDGSIKLMSVDSVSATEMYNTHLSVDSTIDSMIQTSAFCIDDTNNFESVNERVTNNEPVFTCQNGATIKTSKFGGLSIDEAMYGGLYTDSPMFSYITIPSGGYSFSTHKTFLPNYSVIADEVNYFRSSTSLVDFDTIEPTVINVKADTIVNGGSGKEDTPYIID